MEKIKTKPIEIFKNVVIAILTVSMLLLAGFYIGGSQFISNSGAINTANMPNSAVAVGADTHESAALYEKDMLAISYAAISYSGGGGVYGSEPAARDLWEFASGPIHQLLSSPAKIEKTTVAAFENAMANGRYIFFSLTSPLPFQVVYALSGEYVAPAGSDTAFNVEKLLLSFGHDKKAALYLQSGSEYFLSDANCAVNLSEAAAMASDSRLCQYEIVENTVAISSASPHTQTLALAEGKMPSGKAYSSILSLIGYDDDEPHPLSHGIDIVAPHGTLSFTDEKMVYTASRDSGLAISNFLENSVDSLDVSFFDVLLASVSLVEKIQNAYPEMTGQGMDLYVDGFYYDDGTYTVVFGLSDSSIPISGEKFPYLAKLTVSNGRFKSVELNFIGAEKSGKTASLFPSNWEYAYASKDKNIASFMLRYAVDTLPLGELDAHWYYTAKEGEK